jgi:mannose-6-phosphate isomerase-like protein (cupin superfamily)
MKLIAAALLFAAMALPAGDPPGFHYWSSSELKSFTKSLAPKINEQKLATEQLGSHGNYMFMVAHREASGEAEYHAKQADVFVVESGEGNLIYGGSLVNPKTTAPNEMRAPSIKGGMEKKVAAGDVVTIPAATAHQMMVPAGKQITYFVVKITQ